MGTAMIDGSEMCESFAKGLNKPVYSEKDLEKVNSSRIPNHVAIIMDGNRRWAIQKGLPIAAGHWRGAENLIAIVKAACVLKIKVLTVFAFSTENWKRSPVEVKALMHVFKTQLVQQRKLMIEEGVRLNVIGDLSKLPQEVRTVLEDTLKATEKGEKLDLVIALNYGARNELTRAIHSIVEDCLENKLSKEDLSEELIASYLDTAKWKDPDLLIRTSGESRLSNFLLWQISYSEVIVSDILWPAFDVQEFLMAITDYQQRELRLGR